MRIKPLIIILGEPYSTFQEIIFKTYKLSIFSKLRNPIVIVGSLKLFKKQIHLVANSNWLKNYAKKSFLTKNLKVQCIYNHQHIMVENTWLHNVQLGKRYQVDIYYFES